jgi:hypothetical protein
MSFSNTLVTTKEIGNGLVLEFGTWNAASVTTGTITPGTSTSGSPTFNVRNILFATFTSDNDHAVIPSVYGVHPNQIKITTTSSDTGTYSIIGEGC